MIWMCIPRHLVRDDYSCYSGCGSQLGGGTLTNIVPLFGVVAALAAAVFSGMSLYLTGKREERPGEEMHSLVPISASLN